MCMLHPNTVASKTVWGGIAIMRSIANRRGLKTKFRPNHSKPRVQFIASAMMSRPSPLAALARACATDAVTVSVTVSEYLQLEGGPSSRSCTHYKNILLRPSTRHHLAGNGRATPVIKRFSSELSLKPRACGLYKIQLVSGGIQ